MKKREQRGKEEKEEKTKVQNNNEIKYNLIELKIVREKWIEENKKERRRKKSVQKGREERPSVNVKSNKMSITVESTEKCQ